MLLINWVVESQLTPLNPFKIETRYATSYIDGDLEPVYSVQTINHLPLLRQKHWLVSRLSRKELSNLYYTAAFLGVGMVHSAETVCTLVPPLVFGEISAAMLVRFWVSAMKAEATLNCAKKRIESRTLVAAWWKEWRNPCRTRATMVVETRRGCTIRLDSPDRRRCCVIHTCKWGLQPQQELGQKWTDSHDGGPQTPPTVVIFLSLLSIKSTVLGTFILWTNTWC